MYDKGSCAPRDAAQAYRYFAQAAAQGDAQAMTNLGTLYNDGRGVPRDRKLAKQWFEKAAALGVPEAKQNLKGM
jgi:TPR repeat protein